MKKFLLLLILSFSVVYTYADTHIETKIKNTFLDINDVSISRLLAAEKDDSSINDFYYQQDIWKKENELKKEIVSQRIKADSIKGTWNLYDSNTKNFFSDEKGIYIGRTITFSNINDFCHFQHQGSNSYVYKIDDKKFVVFPSMDAGIIRLLYFIDNKLYIYNLDCDYWILDDIHKNGAFYKQH